MTLTPFARTWKARCRARGGGPDAADLAHATEAVASPGVDNMTPGRFNLVSQVGRVPSMTVPLDSRQESRFQHLIEESIMIDLHQHPMVLPEDFNQYFENLRSDNYVWGYDAVRAGGFTAVGTANVFRGMLHTSEMSFIRFSDLLDEVTMMISDISRHEDVLQVGSAAGIEPEPFQTPSVRACAVLLRRLCLRSTSPSSLCRSGTPRLGASVGGTQPYGSYPTISLTTASAGRQRCPQSAFRSPSNFPSTRIRARIIALVTPSPPFRCPHPSIGVHRWIRAYLEYF